MPANYVLLDSVQLTQNTASVVFDNLPTSGYTDLKVLISARGTQAATSHALTLRFNGATTAYGSRAIVGDGTGAGSETRTTIGSAMYLGNMDGSSNTANTFSSVELCIPNYLSSNPKSISVDQTAESNSTEVYTTMLGGLWSTGSPITSISLIALAAHGDFVAFSTFALYGVAALGTEPTVAPKATGGNIVANDGTYWYHAFSSSGTFTPQFSLSCDVLTVAGAGGGGGLGSGGGGGGVIPSSSLTFNSSTNYTIAVGAGGLGVPANNLSTSGGRGTDTTVAHSAGTVTAYGGGGGLAYAASSTLASANGGSGGGGGGSSAGANFPGGTGVSGQGYAGGNSLNDSTIRGGGGGGYSGVGGNASSGAGGNGGQGYNLPTAIQNVLIGTTYVGSGGGGSCRGSTGSAGVGGTGAANGTNNATNAPNPTMYGCGGGGPGQSAPSGAFGSASPGYSGVVVIRYAMA